MIFRTLSIRRSAVFLLGAFVLWIMVFSFGFMTMKHDLVFDVQDKIGSVRDKDWYDVRGHPPGQDRKHVEETDDSVNKNSHENVEIHKGVEMACPEDTRIRGIVNDDYCDCVVSGADEPLTAACAGSQHTTQFECLRRFAASMTKEEPPVRTLQHPTGHRKTLLHMSRVNDGVCDCCDGSDEAFGDAKCDNRCENMGPDADAEITFQAAKRALPRTHLRCAQCPSRDAGPEGIWSYLTQVECLSTPRGDIEYCPFRSGESVIRKIDASVPEAVYSVLGRGPGDWEEKYAKVRLLPGDKCLSTQKEWQVYIIFGCGTQTNLERVAESASCVYDLFVTTPAAC